MIRNLTPHPLHVYPADCPDTIDPPDLGAWHPDLVIEPDPAGPARVSDRQDPEPAYEVDGLPIYHLDWYQRAGRVQGLPDAAEYTYLIVSRPVAMLSHGRVDLLVPHLPVRSGTGQVLGCRAFAMPW